MALSKEQELSIEEEGKKWSDKITKILNEDFNDFDLYVLKCHLILEHELNIYIERRTKERLSMEKAGFSFSNKIKIAKMLGCFEEYEDFIDLEVFLVNINIIRNQIAHRFAYDKKVLRKLFDICKKLDPNIEKKEMQPQKHVFDYVISFFAGALSKKAAIDEHNVVIDFYKKKMKQ